MSSIGGRVYNKLRTPCCIISECDTQVYSNVKSATQPADRVIVNRYSGMPDMSSREHSRPTVMITSPRVLEMKPASQYVK